MSLLDVVKIQSQITDSVLISLIAKSYNDKQFNAVYQKWIDSNRDRWAMPSLDHKQPICKGGSYELGNLQVLT